MVWEVWVVLIGRSSSRLLRGTRLGVTLHCLVISTTLWTRRCATPYYAAQTFLPAAVLCEVDITPALSLKSDIEARNCNIPAWHDAVTVDARILHCHVWYLRRRILDCTLGPHYSTLRTSNICLGPRRCHQSCEGLCGSVRVLLPVCAAICAPSN